MTRYTSLVPVSLVAMVTMLASPSLTNRSHAWSAPTAGAKPARSNSEVANVLSAYERIRALLASDKIEGVSTAARRLESAARKAHLAEIEKAAMPLVKAKDLVAARSAFGKLSRPVVALVQADPALKNRFHVFECPMVTAGANQWVQPAATIENPYMGKRMPTCGTKK